MKFIEISKKLNDKHIEYVLVADKEKYNFTVVEVKPAVVYPECILNGKKQHCFNCNNIENCNSPRSMCIRPYHNHPKGCPNFGKKEGCPPNIPMFDQVYDLTKPIYLIINEFNLLEHVENMRKIHPDWSSYQLYNSRYWQGKSISINKKVSYAWLNEHPNLVLTNWVENMGVDLVKTLKQVDIDLVFKEKLKIARRISCVGEVLADSLDKFNLFIDNINQNDCNVKVLSKKK